MPRKSSRKLKNSLREVDVPPNQLKLTHDEIDLEIIVFDGGDSTTPQIKPPDGIVWHCISVTFINKSSLVYSSGIPSFKSSLLFESSLVDS